MVKRPDEEHCRRSYDSYLAARFPRVSRQWEESERPDYYLTVGGGRLAVEVTSVVGDVLLRAKLVPELALEASAMRLVKEAETQALGCGGLRGSYLVCLGVIEEFGAHREALIEAITQYTAKTQTVPTAPADTILPSLGWDCTISKIGSEGAVIEVLWDSDAKWEQEVQRDLARLLRQAVQKKESLLADISQPLVLLVLDRYHLASARLWRSAAEQLELPQGLVALLRICPDGTVEVLKAASATGA